MRKFHSLLIRIVRHLNLRHGDDRVWEFKRIPLGRWPGWSHVVNTPQFVFGWRFSLADSRETEPGQDIVSSPWGGNVGWPELTDNAVMRIFQEKFFRRFSGQHPGWWADELPFFPFSASFSSTEDLEFQLEVNGI